MKNKVIEKILKEKIIVIVRGVERAKLIPLAEALYEGGIRLLEVTYDATGKVTDEETASNIEILSNHFEGRMYIGAGTVLNEKQVELTAKAGGCFIISPDACDGVIKKTCECGMVSIPGAMTPCEMQSAYKFGADFVKLFPAINLGVEYIKAVTAPLSHIKILAVGGINENNMPNYLDAGICGFGVGSNIIDKKLLLNNDYTGITNLAKKYVEVI